MSSQTNAQENHSTGLAPTISAVAPWRVAAVTALPNYCLALTFYDGTVGSADLAALIQRPDAGIFAALEDLSLFEQVGLVYGAVTWPNGADLDPCWLHEEISRSGSLTF